MTARSQQSGAFDFCMCFCFQKQRHKQKSKAEVSDCWLRTVITENKNTYRNQRHQTVGYGLSLLKTKTHTEIKGWSIRLLATGCHYWKQKDIQKLKAPDCWLRLSLLKTKTHTEIKGTRLLATGCHYWKQKDIQKLKVEVTDCKLRAVITENKKIYRN
jgi:calcineurin-like phosphoesterase